MLCYLKRRVTTVEMDYLWSARLSRGERKMNDEIRSLMNVRGTVVDRIENIKMV